MDTYEFKPALVICLIFHGTLCSVTPECTVSIEFFKFTIVMKKFSADCQILQLREYLKNRDNANRNSGTSLIYTNRGLQIREVLGLGNVQGEHLIQ